MQNVAIPTPYGLKFSGGLQVTAPLTPDATEALVGDAAQKITACLHLGPMFSPEEVASQILAHKTREKNIHSRADELYAKGFDWPRAYEIAILESPLFWKRNEFEERRYQGLKELFPKAFTDNQ